MKFNKFNIVAGMMIFISVMNFKVVKANANYFTDSAQLSSVNQSSYNEITDGLNNWFGKKAESVKLNNDIDSFIVAEPNYIPIYLEKTRYVIKEGYRSNANATVINKTALKSLENLALKAPSYGPIFVLKAHVLTNLQQYELAQDSLNEAASLNAKTVWYHLNLATLRLIKGQVEEAVSAVYSALEAKDLKVNELNAALSILGNNSRYIDPSNDLINLVFNRLTDQNDRLQLARLMARNYSGKRYVLNLAAGIINKQLKVNPDCKRCHLEMANLILVAGATTLRNNVTYFTDSAQKEAKSMLTPLIDDDLFKDRAYDHLINIAFSEENYDEAKFLINHAMSLDVDEIMIGKQQALLLYKEQKYAAAKDVLELLSDKDESIMNDRLLSTIYGRLGDYGKLEEFHLNQIAQMPNNAWTYGNYVTFLLARHKDTKKAIEYGEKGLALMDYPLLRNYLGLAYHIEGAKAMRTKGKTRDENWNLAAEYFTKSLELNDNDYSKEAFCTHCVTMETVLMIINRANQLPENEKTDYLKIGKIAVIMLLIGLILFKFLIKRKRQQGRLG